MPYRNFCIYLFFIIHLCCNVGSNEKSWLVNKIDKIDDAEILNRIKKYNRWFEIKPFLDTTYRTTTDKDKSGNWIIDSSEGKIYAMGRQLDFFNRKFLSAEVTYLVIDDSLVYDHQGEEQWYGNWHIANGQIIFDSIRWESRRPLGNLIEISEGSLPNLKWGFRGDTLILIKDKSFYLIESRSNYNPGNNMFLPPKIKNRMY